MELFSCRGGHELRTGRIGYAFLQNIIYYFKILTIELPPEHFRQRGHVIGPATAPEGDVRAFIENKTNGQVDDILAVLLSGMGL